MQDRPGLYQSEGVCSHHHPISFFFLFYFQIMTNELPAAAMSLLVVVCWKSSESPLPHLSHDLVSHGLVYPTQFRAEFESSQHRAYHSRASWEEFAKIAILYSIL